MNLADAIEELHAEHEMLHRDLSLNNVGLGPDGGILLWDLATATREPADAELTGTPVSMAVSVQLGKPASKSSELEAVLYLLVQLTSGAVHWRKGLAENCDTKWTAMTNPDVYATKVRVLRPAP